MKTQSLVWLLGAVMVGGCISPESSIFEAAKDCPELSGSSEARSTKLDLRVSGFVDAAVSFRDTAKELKADVLAACGGVAKDLGATDTWSSLGDVDQAVTNASGTGACDVAGKLIEKALLDAKSVNANIALAVSRGRCRFDFELQRQCEAACFADATCTAGSVETRCEPGGLSVECSGTCTAGSTCTGAPAHPANCMGKCEAMCTGECKGVCISEDGRRSDDDPNCHGKCSSSCNGTCSGACKVDAPSGLTCGVDVRCSGSCSGTATAPECLSEFTPPVCTVEEGCFAACRAKVAASAICEPTTVKILVDVSLTPQLEVVARTLEKHLPDLLDAADARASVMLNATHALSVTGASLKDKIEDLDGHSLACLGASSTTLAEAAGHFDVSVRSSVTIDSTVRTHVY